MFACLETSVRKGARNPEPIKLTPRQLVVFPLSYSHVKPFRLQCKGVSSIADILDEYLN